MEENHRMEESRIVTEIMNGHGTEVRKKWKDHRMEESRIVTETTNVHRTEVTEES